MKLLISTSSFGEYDDAPVKKLKNAGFEIELNPHGRTLKKEECVKLLNDKVGLIAGVEPLNRDVLQTAKHLKVISRCGAGMDNVDREAAKKLGIRVYNTPDAPTQAVAELALGLIFGLLRNISKNDREIRKGIWNKEMGNLLSGKTIGIVGLGRIGRKLLELLNPFKLKVIACEPFPENKFVKQNNIRLMPLEELLHEADVVSLHIPYNNETKNLIDMGKLSLMKKSAILINASRGGIIVESDLEKALLDGVIKGAALDVFDKEPYNGPLKNLENIILTSHIGSYARESRIQMEMEAVDNLIKGLMK